MKKVNIINFRMRGHAGPAGYDRLADYIDANVISGPSELTITQRAVSAAFKSLISRSGSQWYQRKNFVTELYAAHKWLQSDNQIFHFLYGENSYGNLGRLKSLFRRQNKIVCTFHKPATYFKEKLILESLKQVDAIITVSSEEALYFSELEIVENKNVHFIPHGVDTHYFQPYSKSVGTNVQKSCLFVGSHMRDIATLCEAIRILEQSNVAIQFNIVTNHSNEHLFKGLNSVLFHTNLTDDRLLDLYRSADILVMPLLDATANNSLLEAMACGLPIISTNLKGVRDYVNNDCARLIPKGDIQALAETIVTLAENPDILIKMSIASRQHALSFSWEKIAAMVTNVYADL